MSGDGRFLRIARRLAQRLGHSRPIAWFGARVLTPIDRWLYPRMKGRVLSFGPPVLPTLLLTTTGRRTGQRRTSPLVYVEDGDDLVIVGSNFGQGHHPAWSANLLADPRAMVQVGEERRDVLARMATPEEKERLWPRFLHVWPAYQTYADRSGRDLRMFILTGT